MMKFVSQSFVAAAMAAVSFAVFSPDAPFEDRTTEQSQWDNMCLFCVAEGNLFCGTPGVKEGECMPATCKETEKGTGVCTLEYHSCPPDQTVITSFAQCHYEAPALEKCPGELVITDHEIKSGGVETTDDGSGETIYVPYEMKVSIDPLTACYMEVSSEDLTGAWEFNEWEEDITVFIT